MLKHSKNYIFQQCFKQTPNWLSDICLHKIVNTCSSLMSFFLSFAYIFVFVNSLFVSTCSCLFTFEIKNHAYINVFKLYQILMLNLSAFCLKNVIFPRYFKIFRCPSELSEKKLYQIFRKIWFVRILSELKIRLRPRSMKSH